MPRTLNMKGITLIELMVSIGMVGVLLAVAVTFFTQPFKKGPTGLAEMSQSAEELNRLTSEIQILRHQFSKAGLRRPVNDIGFWTTFQDNAPNSAVMRHATAMVNGVYVSPQFGDDETFNIFWLLTAAGVPQYEGLSLGFKKGMPQAADIQVSLRKLTNCTASAAGVVSPPPNFDACVTATVVSQFSVSCYRVSPVQRPEGGFFPPAVFHPLAAQPYPKPRAETIALRVVLRRFPEPYRKQLNTLTAADPTVTQNRYCWEQDPLTDPALTAIGWVKPATVFANLTFDGALWNAL